MHTTPIDTMAETVEDVRSTMARIRWEAALEVREKSEID
jgi:hypothetical protein